MRALSFWGTRQCRSFRIVPVTPSCLLLMNLCHPIRLTRCPLGNGPVPPLADRLRPTPFTSSPNEAMRWRPSVVYESGWCMKSIVMLHGSLLTDCMSFAPIICPILRLKTGSKLNFFFAGRCPAPRQGAAPDLAGAPPQIPAGALPRPPKVSLGGQPPPLT